MSEIDIVKIVIDVFINLPLLMAIVLYFDYKIDGDYDIEFKMFEYEEFKDKIKDDLMFSLMIRLVDKFHKVVNGNK